MDVQENDHIYIDFYDGADGPTIRIRPQELAGLKVLQELFHRLATKETSEIAIHAMPCVHMVDLTALYLRLGPDGLSPFRLDRIERILPNAVSFVWIDAAETWTDAIDLVEALIQGAGPGHQYLAGGGIYGIQALLTFREDNGK